MTSARARRYGLAVLGIVIMMMALSAREAHAWSASLTISVKSEDGDTPFPFQATGTGSDGSSFDESFVLADGESKTMSLHKGDYRVSESVPDGWKLDDVQCESDAGTADVRTADGKSRIVLQRDENVRCTFVNSKVRSAVEPTVEPAASPPPPPPPPPPAPPKAAPAPAPQAAAAPPPTAKLTAPKACVRRSFRFTVQGAPMWRVALSVNGKHFRELLAPRGQRRFSARIPVKSKIVRLVARVSFDGEAASATKTLRAVVRRCPAPAKRASFTG